MEITRNQLLEKSKAHEKERREIKRDKELADKDYEEYCREERELKEKQKIEARVRAILA